MSPCFITQSLFTLWLFLWWALLYVFTDVLVLGSVTIVIISVSVCLWINPLFSLSCVISAPPLVFPCLTLKGCFLWCPGSVLLPVCPSWLPDFCCSLLTVFTCVQSSAQISILIFFFHLVGPSSLVSLCSCFVSIPWISPLPYVFDFILAFGLLQGLFYLRRLGFQPLKLTFVHDLCHLCPVFGPLQSTNHNKLKVTIYSSDLPPPNTTQLTFL